MKMDNAGIALTACRERYLRVGLRVWRPTSVIAAEFSGVLGLVVHYAHKTFEALSLPRVCTGTYCSKKLKLGLTSVQCAGEF